METASAPMKKAGLRLALVTPDDRMAQRFHEALKGSGFAVSRFSAPMRALGDLAVEPPELAVYHEPDERTLRAGIERLRQTPGLGELPLLCLVPKATPKASAAVLDAGADDCLSKPFSAELFLARVRALLRRRHRGAGAAGTRLRIGPLELDLLERSAVVGEKPMALTRLEFELLGYLMARPGKAVSRAELLQSIWKFPPDVETRTLDKHVETLRRKLGSADWIVTVRAIGYRLKEPK